MRSLVFNVLFYSLTAVFAIFCVILSLIPGRKAMMYGLLAYTKTIKFFMRWVAGIDVSVTGHDNIPREGAVIIAAKHQSYGDGIVMFSEFFDLSFVTGDHLEKFYTLKHILAKMNAVVVDNCGGEDARKRMSETSQIVREQGRRILIYPEGHLSEIGTQHRYRKGVYHLYADFGCPVVPAATNLGQRWNQNDWKKYPGKAAIEFLEPIMPGLSKDEFMRVLEDRIETRSKAMLDLNDLGALNPDNIGKLKENHVAKAKREKREADEAKQNGSGQQGQS
ncbi:lysophospholipid acyltransferase family protein [Fretibacter rubidus]|uniref:lysophospholipid acyltransferase family protein n=1 Tax=Fretibacter rubidus TaxID=570162 RepID=UPI00352BB80F